MSTNTDMDKSNFDLFMEFWSEVKLVAEQHMIELNTGRIAPEHIMQKATLTYQKRLLEKASKIKNMMGGNNAL